MNARKVIDSLAEILAEILVLNKSEIRPSRKLVDDLDADSIAFLEMTYRLRRDFGLVVPEVKVDEETLRLPLLEGLQRLEQTIGGTTLFEYMIANTDVSLAALHNLIVVQTKTGLRYTVPYDFDYSGLVDAQYAVAGKDLGISSVRERLYRGPCKTAAEFEPYFARFRAVKPAVMSLYDTIPELPQSYRNRSKSYLEEFYKTLDRPSEFKRTFVDTCKPYM